MSPSWGEEEVAKMAAAGATTVHSTVLQPVMSQSSTVQYCNAVPLVAHKPFWLFLNSKDIFYQEDALFSLDPLYSYFP